MSPVQKKNYGFVKRLLVWAGTAALIMSLAAAASLFTLSYNEACDEQDDLLEEVTGVLARLDISSKHPSALWMDDDDFEDWFTLDENSPQAIAPPCWSERFIKAVKPFAPSLIRIFMTARKRFLFPAQNTDFIFVRFQADNISLLRSE